MARPDRQELIRNAISFLNDPSVSGTWSRKNSAILNSQFSRIHHHSPTEYNSWKPKV
jgi:hypothetical protein